MKGQLQSVETIAVVIVLTLILLLGLLFYSKAVNERSSNERIVSSILNSEEVAKKIGFLEELSCPNYGAEMTPCVDKIKAELFMEFTNPGSSDYLSNRHYYHRFFGDSDVNITIIYPDDMTFETTPPEKNIRIYHGLPKDASSTITRTVPVAVLDAESGTKGLGLLSVEVVS